MHMRMKVNDILKKYWIQHEDRLYSMDSSHVLDENDNSYIKFTDSDFSCVKMYPGDLLVEFGGGWNYDIYPIESEGYTMPQEFTVDADNGCIEFRRKNLSEKMEENNMPLNKIYEINGETASSIQDYVEVMVITIYRIQNRQAYSINIIQIMKARKDQLRYL